MNFMFENFNTRQNLIDGNCQLGNNPSATRFQVSPMINTLNRKVLEVDLITHTNDNHIIPVGVNGSIFNWSQGKDLGEVSIFDCLSESYLNNLRNKKAIFLIDYSLEGYQTDWLFRWFHDECSRLKIPPQAIVYTVGNMLIDSQYDEWADMRGIDNRIKCIPYAGFEEYIHDASKPSKSNTDVRVNVDKHLEYKKNNKTWSFFCPQKRPRMHRRIFFDKMKDSNLLEKGLCSFPEEEHYINGETHDGRSVNYYIGRLHVEYSLQSFVTVVSEPQYFDKELSTFTSEKVFKPIACYHPFITLGGRGELEILKERGYRTFSDYWDESYDTLPDTKRMDAIIDVVKYIDSIEDKISWFESMRPILEHNKRQLDFNSSKPDIAIVELEKYYREYFNE